LKRLSLNFLSNINKEIEKKATPKAKAIREAQKLAPKKDSLRKIKEAENKTAEIAEIPTSLIDIFPPFLNEATKLPIISKEKAKKKIGVKLSPKKIKVNSRENKGTIPPIVVETLEASPFCKRMKRAQVASILVIPPKNPQIKLPKVIPWKNPKGIKIKTKEVKTPIKKTNFFGSETFPDIKNLSMTVTTAIKKYDEIAIIYPIILLKLFF